MSRRQESGMEPLEEIARLLAIQLRRGVGSQAEAATELSRVGFGPTRIAELLGTSAGTVKKDLQRAKKKTTAAPPKKVDE